MDASGSRIVIGSAFHVHSGIQSGAAWVVSDPGTPAETRAELIPTGAIANMRFADGLAVNADGDVIAIGAPGMPTWMPGNVYVFRFDGTSWIEEWHASGIGDDWLGASVSMSASGDTIAVGAPGRTFSPALYREGAVEIWGFRKLCG
jgi:hypothetical protein